MSETALPHRIPGYNQPGPSERTDGLSNRCVHFSVLPGRLDIPGNLRPLHIPVYRCALTDAMVERLRRTAHGERLAEQYSCPGAAGEPGLVCGPDLELASYLTCTRQRCCQSCQPCYEEALTESRES